jgi:ABC-2 type transport system permease protein
VATALRERVTLFWFLVFPILLLAILATIFGRTGREGEIQFEVALINEDRAAAADGFSAMICGVFEGMAAPSANGEEPLFSLQQPESDEDPHAFLEHRREALRQGRLAAILVIPEGFHDAVLRSVSGGSFDGSAPALRIYMSQNDVGSEMAAEIIGQVLAGVNREILVRTGQFDAAEEIPSETVWVGRQAGEVRYIDFLLPGIILMGFFTNGLFSVPGTILFGRDRKILRRYWVSPLTVLRYLLGFSIGHLALCGLQFGLLYLFGRYAFGATVSFARLDAVLVLLLAAVTFMAVGFLIASIAKTANAGMATANILNMPMMFLSGMFFPTAGLPAFLLAVVYVNPVSYLVEGLRASVDVQTPTFPAGLTVVVPLAWIALTILVAAKKLRWDVSR